MNGKREGQKRKLTDSQVDALSYQLDVARELQSWLLPRKMPVVERYEFDACYDPAEVIAGDYYDFVEHPKGSLGIVVADACGSGVPAALLMVHIRGLLRSVTRDMEAPADALRAVNRVLLDDLRAGTSVTAQYVRLIPERRALHVASAGHQPLLVLRARTREVACVRPKGMALGSGAPAVFDPSLEQVAVALEPGDRFVMMTNGATRVRNPSGDEFGIERFVEKLREYVALSSSDVTALLLAALRDHRETARRADDITIITGRLLPNG
ncbi:MAG: PP2C family protein-serine/threonine phosphatase [Planctomycetes bacterium]|nr:PP2C family protein-serine/threonine phosphatase [Planctomycetota bacterium]